MLVVLNIGEDEIGFANAPDLVINARAAGAPIKIIAVIQQISYHGFWVKVDSPIHSPKDWEGKRVGVKYASPTYLIYQVLCKKLGIDRKKITEVPLNYGLQPFLDGEIDVYPGAFTNEAISIELMGIGVRRFYPQNYGIETCSNVIFTTEDMIKNKPHLVKKFVQATIKGWEWCLKPENAEESIDFLIKHSNHLQKDKERTALELNRLLVNPREKEKLALKLNISLVKGSHYTIPYIGWINKGKFRAIIGYMKEFGVLKEDIRVDDLITTQFLPTAQDPTQN